MYLKIIYLSLLIGGTFTNLVNSSNGDLSRHYENCLEMCGLNNCSEDGKEFKEYYQPFILKMTLWNCNHECKYECMWRTVEKFHERNWTTPQFFGKWPLIRILGMQEPASVIFSLLNGYVHIKMMRKFREKVRPSSPLVWLWNVFFIVSVHAWFWSAVFHYRDFEFTKFLDYTCAFSLILMNCYLMSIRLLYDKVPGHTLIGLTIVFILFLMKHVTYLSADKISNGYNMKVNISLGTFLAACWLSLCYDKRKCQKYVWKCAMYVALAGMAMLLELFDRPPYFYIFDYRSIWLLSAAPIVTFIYSFGIDDCRYLRAKKCRNSKKMQLEKEINEMTFKKID